MKTLKLEDIKNSKVDDFFIINNNNKYGIEYKNEEFTIDTETQFKNCDIYWQNNMPKIKMIFNSETSDFLEVIEILYEKISYVVEKNDEIILSHIINPIYKPTNGKKILFGSINKKTIIKNIENNELMELDELKNKKFNIYPIIDCIYMNLYNDKMYINFSLHTIFIKLIKNYNINIDYNKIKKIMEK